MAFYGVSVLSRFCNLNGFYCWIDRGNQASDYGEAWISMSRRIKISSTIRNIVSSRFWGEEHNKRFYQQEGRRKLKKISGLDLDGRNQAGFYGKKRVWFRILLKITSINFWDYRVFDGRLKLNELQTGFSSARVFFSIEKLMNKTRTLPTGKTWIR